MTQILNPVAGDNAPAINAAINALPPGGGDVVFNPGVYTVASPIMIGDGTINKNSTRRGVRLLGSGVPSWPVGNNQYGSLPTATQLDWIGPQNGSMIQINGPLSGWGVENLLLTGNSVAGAGINVFGANNGAVRNICITGITVGAIMSRPLQPLTSGGYAACMRNLYEHICIEVPAFAHAKGVYLGMDGSPNPITDDTYYNAFIDVEVELVKTDLTTYCFYLQVCDTNSFFSCTAQSLGGSGAVGYMFDYSFEGYPAGNGFFACDCAGFAGVGQQIVATGPGNPGTGPNYFIGMSPCNGGLIPNTKGVISYEPRVMQTIAMPLASLPVPGPQTAGMRAFVNDSGTRNFGQVAVAGGSNKLPVYCDGTSWRIG